VSKSSHRAATASNRAATVRERSGNTPPDPANRIPPLRLALFLIALLASFSLLPFVRANPNLSASFWGATAVLLVLLVALRRQVARAGRVLRYEVAPKPVHYVQLTMQASIYVYWGWYWREVYHHIPLIVAQIVFVYALDMLVCWWRRDKWIMGFGPFPIVLSTNLFLWFKDDWFSLQFLMVATGVLCKEFVTWKREGRRVHIFNPSAIALAVFSLGLLVTHSTHISWGEEIAVTLGHPPNIYIEIFIVGLVVQALFSVTLVTLSAAASLCLLNVIYTGSTGLYYFVDINIPAAVFLGLHLLVTDPATSPRKNLGKILFGAMYGVGVFGLYALLDRLSAPTFYDKLLCVPPLNLMVQLLDRAGVAVAGRFGKWFSKWSPRQLNFAHMAVWISLFGVMATTGFVGGRHPGSDPEFWHRACEVKRGSACKTWIQSMNVSCQHGSARACVTLGTALNEGRLVPRDPSEAGKDFGAACDLGVRDACRSLVALVKQDGAGVFQRPCDRGDGESCLFLASLYYGGAGVLEDPARAVALFRRSCDSGWPRGCGGLAECFLAGRGIAADSELAIQYLEKACRAGIVVSCYRVAGIYHDRKDEARAQQRFRQACDLSTRYAETDSAYFRPGSAPARTDHVCSEVDR
jgi:TPR repeat protein